MRNILIIEDNETMREGMVQALAKLPDVAIEAVADGETGLGRLEEQPAHIVVSDYRMAGMDGLALTRTVKDRWPGIEVVVVTAFGSIEVAVEAMQAGATDFITKPFSPGELQVKIQKIMDRLVERDELERMREENQYLRQELSDQLNFGEMIGQSAPMQAVFRTIEKVALSDSTVIIYGESGTGKELVARMLHQRGLRKTGPFVRVNCGAIAETLLESEFFGHEKGAFTGALRRKKGRFELANRGTILLDEIGDIPQSLQTKLLRVLQEKEFERVGGEETIHVDTRVIASTHRDLKAMVDSGDFREDLYYRLHVIPIQVPPLRERPEDIPLLVDHFLSRLNRRTGVDMEISQSAVRELHAYEWPGNVRELENVLERAAVLCEGSTITSRDLPLFKSGGGTAQPADATTLDAALAEMESRMIRDALEQAEGNKTRTAQILGIKTSALYYKLAKYGLEQ